MTKQVKSKKRVAERGEVFTAEREVKAMCDLVAQECDRIDSRFLEPVCGNGNFLAEILTRKLASVKRLYKSNPYDFDRYSVLAVSSIYGVDIMQDNTEECRKRMYSVWEKEYKSVCKKQCNDDTRKSIEYALSHTLWFLPNVASCYAMHNLLRRRQNNFFDDYKIIVCAGTKAGIGIDALSPVLNAMGDPLKTKTITLSCGKLTTGVTVRPWAGVFMLRNLKSPETYFQTAFRTQSPWEIKDECGNRRIIKKECYVFDFALERALHQISDYSCRLKVDDTSPEQKVSEFINFLPVLAFDGSSMNRIDAQDILDITYAGTSATLLAKRWQTALLVHVDNDTLKKLQSNQDALDALMNIEGFRSLNSEIQTIINRSEKVKKLKKEKGDGLTKQEKKELSEDEKKAKSLRKQVQENLLKLAARIPPFMYLTDYREQTIKDVITQIEPELFKKVTGLSVKDFDILCSIGLFDPEKMNQGIFGFRKYENSSLNYTGIDKHEGEAVGGWDTVLRREEYEALYSKQQAAAAGLNEEAGGDTGAQNIKNMQNESGTAHYTAHSAYKPEKTAKPSEEKEPEKILADIEIGTAVKHGKFGDGAVVWTDKAKKYIRIKFSEGEKQFVFPDAFISGFLSVN